MIRDIRDITAFFVPIAQGIIYTQFFSDVFSDGSVGDWLQSMISHVPFVSDPIRASTPFSFMALILAEIVLLLTESVSASSVVAIWLLALIRASIVASFSVTPSVTLSVTF